MGMRARSRNAVAKTYSYIFFKRVCGIRVFPRVFPWISCVVDPPGGSSHGSASTRGIISHIIWPRTETRVSVTMPGAIMVLTITPNGGLLAPCGVIGIADRVTHGGNSCLGWTATVSLRRVCNVLTCDLSTCG